MLEHKLYKQGDVEMLVTTEITHYFTGSLRRDFYSVHVKDEWHRLREDLIKKSGETPEQVLAHWSGYVTHKEVQANIDWINKYYLPKAEVVQL
jgi:malate synthase